jgi:hypothetical protein
MKKLLLRALGIWTLKSVSYAAFIVVSILYFLGSVSAPILTAIYDAVLFFLAFLFSEWIFKRGIPNLRKLIVVILVTFLWDAILVYAFSMWILGPYRYSAPFFQNLILLAIHAAAMSLAYYSRKRFAAVSGLAEGLES